MCLLWFLGAEFLLPEQRSNDFTVEEMDASYAELAGILATPHRMALRCHMGCGCGFRYASALATKQVVDELRSYGDPGGSLDRPWIERSSGIRSVTALRQYLGLHARTGPLRMLVAWSGKVPPDGIAARIVGPEHFGGEEFRPPDHALYLVRSQA